jgi:hypothetical protein
MSRLHFTLKIFESLGSVVAPRKERGAQASGITPSSKESDLKYLKKLPNKKRRTVMCAAVE